MVFDSVDGPVQETVICEESDVRLDPFWKIVDMTQKQQGSKHRTLGNAGTYWSLTRFLTFDDNAHLSLSQEVGNPVEDGTPDTIILKLEKQSLMRYGVKGLAEI